MSARGWLAALLAALTLLAAGCATVPSSSSPVVVDTVGADSPSSTVAAPAADRDPDFLVCDYVGASAVPADRHAAARQYLTAATAQAWDDSASTTILANVGCIPTGSSPDRPGHTTILLRGDAVGRLSATGSYTPIAPVAQYSEQLDLVQVDGQWRIDSLPSGVVMLQEDFQDSYRRVPVYFLDPGLTTVVPDPRWVVNDTTSLAGRLVDLLLAGPSSTLSPAVVSELPPRSSLRRNVGKGDGGETADGGRGVEVDFADLGELDAAQRDLLAAQVVWTLDGAGVVGPYHLSADGAPLDDAHADGWTASDVVSTDPAADPGASVPLHAVRGGSLVRVDTSQAGSAQLSRVAGTLGTLGSLSSAALSPDGSRVAAVARTSGGVRLLVGATGAAVAVVATGESFSRPTWAPDGSAVWVVQNGTTVLRTSQDTRTGAISTQQVDTTALGATAGKITSLRLSRDGTRAALVVGGVVGISVVTRTSTGTVSLSVPEAIAPSLGTGATTLDWAGSDSLLVARTSSERPVVTVSLDGSELRELPGNNLSAPVRAVAASPAFQLVADNRGVWQLASEDLTGQRTWRLVDGLGGTLGPTSVPVLPG